GMAYAARRDPAARGEELALHEFLGSLSPEAMLGPLNKAKAIFNLAWLQLEGEMFLRNGKARYALDPLQRAVETEDELNYDEPPPWPLQPRLSLGEALLALGKKSEAAQVYREDLKRYPDNGWALYGLFRATKSAESRKQFDKAWSRADVKLTASRF